ncbi:MAG TPA: hypothetical protein VGN17_24795 [Bryobacteraceae bacterium]|jgi:hypothetical protein
MNDLIVLEKVADWEKLKLSSIASFRAGCKIMALDEFLEWFQRVARLTFTKVMG